jgi:hypothetical protein
MFYGKLAEAKEEKRRLSGKQKLGLGLGAAGLLTAGILGRKRIGAMFNRGAPAAHAPKPTTKVVGDGIVDTPEELYSVHLSALVEGNNLRRSFGTDSRKMHLSSETFTDNIPHIRFNDHSTTVTPHGTAHPGLPGGALRAHNYKDNYSEFPSEDFQLYYTQSLEGVPRHVAEKISKSSGVGLTQSMRINEALKAYPDARVVRHPLQHEQLNDVQALEALGNLGKNTAI